MQRRRILLCRWMHWTRESLRWSSRLCWLQRRTQLHTRFKTSSWGDTSAPMYYHELTFFSRNVRRINVTTAPASTNIRDATVLEIVARAKTNTDVVSIKLLFFNQNTFLKLLMSWIPSQRKHTLKHHLTFSSFYLTTISLTKYFLSYEITCKSNLPLKQISWKKYFKGNN